MAVALPAAPVQRPRVLIVGTAFAAAGMLMLFAGMLGVYLTRRSEALLAGDTWLPEGVDVQLTQPTMMLATLVLSVFSIQWAVYAASRDDKVNTYLSLGLTFVFGIAFVNMASYNYSTMGFDVAASPQAVLVYAITGANIAMVVLAMVFVALMAFRALGGQQTSRAHDGISSAALFWHANVLVFSVIWLAIYVMK
jgi:heme/copper-type cytochrome/quinol oxidase subunit 3